MQHFINQSLTAQIKHQGFMTRSQLPVKEEYSFQVYNFLTLLEHY
jgi:hypothetical protein